MAFCNFCNTEIAKGTGEMYVIRDGTVFNYCSSKCKTNSVKLRREGRLMKWTSKTLVLSSGKKVEEKKESAFAKDVAKKLEEKKAAAPAAKK